MTDDDLETWAERAAIREFDGKMPRKLAEKLAWQDVAAIRASAVSAKSCHLIRVNRYL